MTKDPILVLEQLGLHVTIADLQMRSNIFVADTLAAEILLRNKFINQQIVFILRNKLKVILQSMTPIAILSSHSKTASNAVATNYFDTIQVTVRDADVKVAKQILLKAASVTTLLLSPLRDVFYGLNRTLL